MPKKKELQSESEGEAGEVYVVEVIKAARVEDGDWKYLVKWADYPSDADTWEPEENLANCSRLMNDFWDDVGVDDDDYTEGYLVKARPSWIKREKQKFQRQNKKKTESSEEDNAPEASASRADNKRAAPTINKKGLKGKGQKQGKRGGVRHASMDSQSSDDAPLSSIRSKGKKRSNIATVSGEEKPDRKLSKSIKIKRNDSTPPLGAHKSAEKEQPKPEAGDSDSSAGSLFSEKTSSPLKILPPPAPAQRITIKIPMKRSSTDESAAQRPGKRQVLEMPMQITATSGNATKTRLAQRAPPAPNPASGVPKPNLSNLSFKKNSSTGSNTAPPLPRRSASASDSVQSPVTVQGTPTEPQATMDIGGIQDVSHRASMQLPRRTTLKQTQPPRPGVANDAMVEATSFLSDIMPDSMAAPMQEDAPEMPPPPVPIRPAQGKLALPRIPKKWKWTGDLFMDVSRDRAEHVCEVLISEATDPLPGGLRFNICLSGERDNMRFSAFYDLFSLQTFLLASTRVPQFAKMGPASDKDADAVLQLSIFMQKRSYFCFAHLYLDSTSVGLLVVFPTGHELAYNLLKVPSTLDKNTPLQVALVPWELTAREFRAANWKSRTPTVEYRLDPAFIATLDAAGRRISTQRRFYQALHILSFPKAIYDFISQKETPRPYCIWNASADTTQLEAIGYETSLLQDILSTCRQAKDLGYHDGVRVVFVHVGALATLYRLPNLVARRTKQPWVRFLTYGSHPRVTRERWGVREIYLLGGVVTFTPAAIIEGNLKLFRRIKDIAEHPLWDCYVLPSVVAMVAKLTCQGEHPLRVYDEGNFVHEDLLKAIEHGTIALLQAPAILRDAPPMDDPSLLWTRWQLRLPSMNARQILEECLRIAAEQFADTSNADLAIAIEKEIERDLLRMQVQPVMMDNYRRFVAIKGSADIHLKEDKCPGIEITTLSKLEFKDDYFATTASA